MSGFEGHKTSVTLWSVKQPQTINKCVWMLWWFIKTTKQDLG